MDIVQRLEDSRRAKESARKTIEKLFEQVSNIMDVIPNVAWKLCQRYSLDYRLVVVLLELLLIIVIQGIGGIKISRYSKQPRRFES